MIGDYRNEKAPVFTGAFCFQIIINFMTTYGRQPNHHH